MIYKMLTRHINGKQTAHRMEEAHRCRMQNVWAKATHHYIKEQNVYSNRKSMTIARSITVYSSCVARMCETV